MKRKAPSRRKSVAKHPRIAITYDIVTHESAAEGDTAENGWIDQEGVSMKPDADEAADGVTAVDKAVEMLRDNGATEASSSSFHTGIWYTNNDHDTDYITGAVESRSYHLKGFTPEEERAVYAGMRGR